MSKPPLYRTPHLFDAAFDAVEFFNDNRADTVPPLPLPVLEFLQVVEEYDPLARFNVQPGFNTHYVAVAAPDDFNLWLFAKPGGVTFALGDERNVEAVVDFLGGQQLEELPPRLLPTDVWFPVGELFDPVTGRLSDVVELSLRIAASWAAPRSSVPA